MKTSDEFKNTIQEHLDKIAIEDKQFAKKLENPKKNIDDCIQYILNTVKKTGANGFIDDEIFGMAIHYIDEETIDIGEKIEMEVKVNHHVELTNKEKAELKEKAKQEVLREAKAKMTTRKQKPTKVAEGKAEISQASLF